MLLAVEALKNESSPTVTTFNGQSLQWIRILQGDRKIMMMQSVVNAK
jgi:hypothetical protein